MNIDLGSPVLDIVIGLSFVFFLLSVIASAINEGIAGILNLRGKTLEEGLLGMIGDAELVDRLLDHPLVRTELDKNARKGVSRLKLWFDGLLPRRLRSYERASSYLSPELFAIAFKAVYAEPAEPSAPAAGQKNAQPSDSASRESMEKQVQNLRKGNTAVRATWQKSLENWFDAGMERVSGWYKRKSQIYLIVIAVVVAVGLNANTLRIAQRLDQDPATRSSVVAAAEKAVGKPLGEKEQKELGAKAAKEKKPLAQVEIEGAVNSASEATKEVSALGVPLLWGDENNPSKVSLGENVLGWLLTMIAISLGAPFWFDTLGRLSNLRSTGERPEDKTR